MDYQDGIKEIIKYYKSQHQTLKLAEESVELADASFKLYKNKGEEDVEHLIEEIADVEVLIDQLKIIYPEMEKRIPEYKTKKVKRQLERISK